jgi:hypothetical protein
MPGVGMGTGLGGRAGDRNAWVGTRYFLSEPTRTYPISREPASDARARPAGRPPTARPGASPVSGNKRPPGDRDVPESGGSRRCAAGRWVGFGGHRRTSSRGSCWRAVSPTSGPRTADPRGRGERQQCRSAPSPSGAFTVRRLHRRRLHRRASSPSGAQLAAERLLVRCRCAGGRERASRASRRRA